MDSVDLKRIAEIVERNPRWRLDLVVIGPVEQLSTDKEGSLFKMSNGDCRRPRSW